MGRSLEARPEVQPMPERRIITLPLKDGKPRSVEVTPIVEGMIWKVDLRSVLEAAHPQWQQEMTRVARSQPEVSFKGGAVNTSREDPSYVTQYQPTTGDVIERELPWLDALYENEFAQITAEVTGDPSIKPGKNKKRYANINFTRGKRNGEEKGRGYEKHEDEPEWTLLGGGATVKEGDGGRTLVWDKAGNLIAAVRPEEGMATIFTGHLEHAAEEFTGVDYDRMTYPFNFFTDRFPEPELTAEDVENALYTSAANAHLN
jgi:hypothetical protein